MSLDLLHEEEEPEELNMKIHILPASLALSSLNNFICPRCNGISQQPQQIKGCTKSCCKKSYCLSCIIEHHKTSPNACPFPSCNSAEHITYELSTIADDIINETQMKCKNYKASCNFEGNLTELIDHLNTTCKFEMIIIKGCEHTIERQNKKDHIKKCPSYPKKCPDCGQVIFQKLWNKHLKECIERVIDCPFKQHNCKISKMKFKDLKLHKEQNIVQHLDLTNEQFIEYMRMLREEISILKQDRQELADRVQKLELDAFERKRLDELKELHRISLEEIVSSEIKDDIKSDDIKSDDIKSDDIKADDIKPIILEAECSDHKENDDDKSSVDATTFEKEESSVKKERKKWI